MTLDDYREPATRAVSLFRNPTDRSCDNACLFSVVAYELGLINRDECIRILSHYEAPGGMLQRYPGSTDWCSWDDTLAACVADADFALRCWVAMEMSKWTTPDGKYLGRFPLLWCVVKARAGYELTFIERVLAASLFIANCFEKYSETSGKQLHWLASQGLGGQGWIVRAAIGVWRARMNQLYPGGLGELFGIYYTDPEHPFLSAAPETF